MRYKLTKKLIYKIINEEIIENQILTEIIFPTKLDNFYYSIKEKIKQQENLKDTNPEMITTPLGFVIKVKKELQVIKYTPALWSKELNHIRIMPNIIKKNNSNSLSYLYDLIKIIYHEYNHQIKLKDYILNENFNTIESFTIALEELLFEETDLYLYQHNDFYEEIIANVYSIEKTKNFLQQYPNIYEKLKMYIDNERLWYQIDWINYDLEQFLNYLTKKIKCSIIKKSLYHKFYSYKIVQMLYNQDGSFKPLSILFQDKEWTSLDKKLQYTIVASKSYLQVQGYQSLTTEELEFILESLKYSYQKELERSNQNEQLEQQINNFNQSIHNKILTDEITLVSNLNYKQQRNTLKIEYLQKEILKISTLLFHTKTNVKEKIRT